MTTPIKIAIGLGTVGTVGGGAYLVHQQLSTTDNIQKKLEADKYQILSKNANEWADILKSYEDTIKVSENAKLKFDDFLGTGDKAKEKIQEHCENALKESSENSETYNKAKKWCTVPRTLTDILASYGHRALNINGEDDDTDQKEWNDKLDEYIKQENADRRIASTTISKGSKWEKANRQEIKKQCGTLNTKKHYEKDFDKDLEKAKLWCAITTN